VFAVNNGLSFAYSAKGDYKKAQEHAEKALAQAPEAQKAAIQTNIAKLKEGKDINQ
jgi:tetratricopeptide (TPR) repeat protein